MTEQRLDLRRLLRMLIDHRLLLALFVTGGVAAGAVLALVQARSFVARSVVVLPSAGVDARGNALRDMATEVEIARSSDVLAAVGKKMSPAITLIRMRKQITVRALSVQLLEVRGVASSAKAAAQLADNVAEEYIAVRSRTTAGDSDAEIGVLVKRATELIGRVRELETEIVRVTTQVAALGDLRRSSDEGFRLVAVDDSLRLDQADSTRQLATLNNRIADARLDAELRRRGTRLLQPAIVPKRPTNPRPGWSVAFGALLGALLATAVVTVKHWTGRRLIWRDDIANLVGAPVLVSLNVPRVRGVKEHRLLLANWQPNVVEGWALQQAAIELGVWSGLGLRQVVVVALAGDHDAAIAAAQLAIFLASSDRLTGLVVLSEDSSAGDLRAACSLASIARRTVRPSLIFPSVSAVEDLERQLDALEALVTIVTVEAGAVELPLGPKRVILAVTSGFATPELLAMAAVACAEVLSPISGVIVGNPDPADTSIGRTPPRHLSLERKAQPAPIGTTNCDVSLV